MRVKSLLLSGNFLLSLAANRRPDPAWNGQTPSGSTPSAAAFTPFYVPPGAKSYDSESPFVHYSGQWIERFSSSYVGKSARWSNQPGAQTRFTFVGTGIEWFGSTDNMHGLAIVSIDGDAVQEVNTYHKSTTRLTQQRLFWKYDLPYGTHTIQVYNVGKRPNSKKRTGIDVDAFVVYRGSDQAARSEPGESVSSEDTFSPTAIGIRDSAPEEVWSLAQQGNTGVSAMQIAVISPDHALVIDKVEHNPITIDGHPAWAALYNLHDHSVIPLRLESNSFCAGGAFLSNGTLVNVGGNPVVSSHTSAADFGDLAGLQAIRLFDPCSADGGDCEFYEHHERLRMASPGWYNTVIRINDGSAMIIGGSKKGGWMNNATVNNPTLEFFPPKNIQGSNGLPIELPFLRRTLYSNLFPIAFLLPDGRIFVAANNDAMIYDWLDGTETILPSIPNGVRVTYPMAGTGTLLPLTPDNDYLAEVLLCGGSDLDDTQASYDISSQDPASSQCSRITLTDSGIDSGWQVEQMPSPRLMPNAVLLPTGDILIVNGAETGISGYGNVQGQVGVSNADNPALTPVLYRPYEELGQRFTQEGLPTSDIPRMYHSVATLTPNGGVMIAGSNPNLDRSEIEYGTEYRVEWLNPPYMRMERPRIVSGLLTFGFGEEFELAVEFGDLERTDLDLKVVLMDLGFVTHAVHASSRLVYLRAVNHGGTLSVDAPPNGNIYPPGPGWLYVVINGVPSKAIWVMVGDGDSPPVDQDALNNMLDSTDIDQYDEMRIVKGAE